MNTFFWTYLICWISICLFTIILFVKNRKDYAISHKSYWQFLFKQWKVATFIVATICLMAIAPYSGDPTWDYFDAFFMAALTYLTAPWSIGALYKVIRRELQIKQAIVAICIWMFTASWSYDLYILLRDGTYPITWYSNIFASSILYILAGMFWNLDWIKGKGIIFSFMEKEWPVASSDSVFTKILCLAVPIMMLVAFLFVYFFLFQPK